MDLSLRPPERDELEAASELCLRSKAYWGYDAAFMAACREELTITPEDVDRDPHILAIDAMGIAGIAQVSFENGECYLEKCFVDTDRIGQGVGRVLYEWAVQSARRLGASEMIIEADPEGAPFYEKMGAVPSGHAASGSIPGRKLPRFVQSL